VCCLVTASSIASVYGVQSQKLTGVPSAPLGHGG